MIAIRADGLSKSYRIGGPVEKYKTLRDSVSRFFTSPFRQKQADSKILWALQDVSFEIKQGEIIGVIGRNGAGKSTLLKILSRITEPTKGCAEIHGRLSSLLEVGTGFHAELTGRENIYLNAAILGMKRREIDKKFDSIVSFAEVEKFIDTPVKHYSSGMYLRLAFAVASHLEPEILLVDEVLAVGDFSFQAKCADKMKSVSEEGRTVLFVSHNLGVIQKLCSRSLLLHEGRKVLDGPTAEVIQAYTAGGVMAEAEYQQPADPSKAIHLRRVKLLSVEGKAQSQFRFDEPVQIVVEYEVNKPTSFCAVWLSVFTSEGTVVFGSADGDTDESRFKLRQTGYYRTVLNLPEKWLNAGNYNIVAGITQYAPLFNYDRVEAVGFTIHDLGTPEKLLTGHSRPGVLQPFLKWETTLQE